MKRISFILLLTVFSVFPGANSYGQAIIIDAIKEATKKVIRAIDLQVQRLQNKTIELQNIQKQIENQLSKLKLAEIAEWTEKHKAIYEEYFDELWRVKSAIAYYRRVTEVIQKQKELVREYNNAYKLFQQDKNFRPDELQYIRNICSGIIEQSLQSVDQIMLILQSFSVQMSDADRLEIINRTTERIEEHIADMRSFTDQAVQLSLQRARDQKEIQTLRKLYGLDKTN
jgi:TATA-box binding protein (TBP) (component of TFIID and TFIIIB)